MITSVQAQNAQRDLPHPSRAHHSLQHALYFAMLDTELQRVCSELASRLKSATPRAQLAMGTKQIHVYF